MLADTKDAVLRRQAQLRGRGLEDLDAQLRRVSGFAFYNTSRYDFEKLLADAPHLAANLRNHIAGFSPNMREVLEKFDFDNTISKLDEAGLLFRVLEPFKNVDLHPDKIDNPTMGTIFEELIRKFNEALNENPGEHFTPRDVVHLIIGVGDAVAVEPEEITYPTLLAALPAPRLRAYPRELTIAEKSFAFRSSLFHAYRVAS